MLTAPTGARGHRNTKGWPDVFTEQDAALTPHGCDWSCVQHWHSLPFPIRLQKGKINELLKAMEAQAALPPSDFCGKPIAPWGHFHFASALPGTEPC